MPSSVKIVTSVRNCGNELPEWATEFVVLSTQWDGDGTLEELAKRCRINRSGYQGIDIVMFVTAYFTSGLNCGFKEFAKRARPHGEKLAALWGRRKWPTPAAISRALKKAAPEQVQEFVNWLLLLEAPQVESLSSIRYSDTAGEDWMVFHWDPTDHVFHQRALPNRGDDPEPARYSEAISAPGYPGRKRGNAILSQAKLSHSGSGLWHSLTLRAGNSQVREDLRAAIRQTQRWCESRRWCPQRTMVVVDGVTQGWAQIDVGCASDVAMLTRMSCYQLLERPGAAKALRRARWETVHDSGSGPTRYATELGVWNGCRLIVSRFQSDDANGSGKGIAGWHYEIFAFTDTRAAWPAAELVSLYYGRCAIENRFAQENAEFGLDKIFSYSEGGQLLCLAVGMSVWNRRIARGTRLALAQGEVLEQSIARTQRDRPAIAFEYPQPIAPVETAPKLNSLLHADVDPQIVKANWFRYLDVETTLRERFPGWRWDADSASFVCPSGELARVFTVERLDDCWRVRFQTRMKPCRGCSMRSDCTTSTSPNFRKQLDLCIPFDRCPLTEGSAGPEVLGFLRNKPVEPSTFTAGTLTARGPQLLPAKLRRLAVGALVDGRASVVIHHSPSTARPTPFLATTDARSHRRQTWEQRLEWNRARHESVQLHLATTNFFPGLV